MISSDVFEIGLRNDPVVLAQTAAAMYLAGTRSSRGCRVSASSAWGHSTSVIMWRGCYAAALLAYVGVTMVMPGVRRTRGSGVWPIVFEDGLWAAYVFRPN